MTDEPKREILTIEEAAQLLRVSVKTFNKVLHNESIPGRKIGREWKFSRTALIDWIGAGRSDDFYREARPQGNRAASEGTDSKGTIPAAPKKGGRRTSGWQLKLD